ncbi:hypothetical protein Mkiyose1088_40380 [Mycobacterium kiyosense]|nr:hypothetical protein Mkiyose1088_40380 [Mycobacterium kiyosense]
MRTEHQDRNQPPTKEVSMTTFIVVAATMIFIAALAIATARRWPTATTWIHIAMAVTAPIAAETIHLLIH